MSYLSPSEAADLVGLVEWALDTRRQADTAAVELASAVYPLDQADARAKLHHRRSQADAAEVAVVDRIHRLVRQAPASP